MQTPIGQMRTPITVLTPIRITDSLGGEQWSYSAASNPVYAALRSVTTTEGVQFGQVSADVTHVLYGHWGDLNTLGATHRIRDYESGNEFDIVGAPINSPKRDWTRLNLVHRVDG